MKAKYEASYTIVQSWLRDWSEDRTARMPKPGEIIRWKMYQGPNGVLGQIRDARDVFFGEHFNLHRPALIIDHGNGQKSGRGSQYADCTRVQPLLNRYRRFLHYMTEIKPAWRIVADHWYADNSIEREEISATGQTRRRMIKCPSGDIC